MANEEKRELEKGEKIGHEELYDLLISRELSWQAIIYDLIKSEQLDPWDIDIALLTQRYIEKIREMEEANFFISSKIMFATALLLRIKSELLLERYIKSLDDILFPKLQQEQPKPQINISLDDVTELLPRTPLPRLKKVTLQELMSALDRAMITEQRRIKKEIKVRQLVAQTTFFLPRQKVNIRDKIQEIYSKIKGWFKQQTAQKMAFTQLAGNERNNRISTFIPLLHLDHQERVLLEQEKTFDEIFIYLFR